ncbi:MAG: methionine synthase [Armatimonadetes bacterium]|nr:methionine synthase [Armatimonadota bacterium]PIU61657.1 MAG: methionine synthase [Armatimonadetes bacterium CG07_land_8_20_14_0_80_59_28]PIX38286.1 MAG: methionine synthase [Armatimonadetes bacterium CG_4_8_14_3_um_filter_58_9]PIY43694.1 MAG: methionine synthase [Armatimonadetes bacterium CG_4_10_14_3_um_filter_59_10]
MDNLFVRHVRERVAVLDGAMGTSIQLCDLSLDDFRGLEGCNEILCLSRPDIIRDIHSSFLQVGCHAVETNTFGANRVVLAEYGIADRAYEINLAASRLAREVVASYSTSTNPRFTIGSMGPGTKLPSLGHISFDDLTVSYEEQALGLIDGGCDVLLIETCQDILQAKAAIAGARRAKVSAGVGLPMMVQVTIETTGAMLVGTAIDAALTTLEPYGLDAIGMNCATGPAEMNDAIRYLGEYSPAPVSCVPNAGLPTSDDGKAVYHLTPEDFALSLREFVTEYGVSIVGGCCGTTPEHLKALIEAVGNCTPRRREAQYAPSIASCYTSAPIRQEPAPTIVAEKMNATTQSGLFREMVQEERFDEMLSLARGLVNEGSHALDVCVAIVGEDEKANMRKVISSLATRVSAPLVIDSTEADAIEEALKHIPGRAIINSINLEDGEKRTDRVCPLAREFGAAVIALTIDEDGMALTAQKKLEIAERIHSIATVKHGLRPQDLIFDPLVLPISTGQEEYRTAGMETLEAVFLIKEKLPGCFTNLGVSNISFGLSPHSRRVLNSVFLHKAVERGLDMAIVNYEKIFPLFKIPDEEVDLARRLIEHDTSNGNPLANYMNHFDTHKGTAPQAERLPDRVMTLEERIKHMLINGERVAGIGGRQVRIQELLEQAMQERAPLEIINTILLDGMRTVGDLFGNGKMQLPSVLDAAQVMKASVTFLEPHLDRLEGMSRGKVVLATVKGDVHDIGKNLVDIILSNNGYQIVNLGIKQPSDNIISAALEQQADAIGLSGLLVKSTVEMKHVLEDLARRELTIPVLCGGAALTRRYVEKDLRQTYRHGVFYGDDAFAGLKTMDALMDTSRRAAKLDEGRRICDSHTDAVGGNEAKKTARRMSRTSDRARTETRRDIVIPVAPFWGTRVVDDLDLREVFRYVNPIALFKGQWQIRGLSRKGFETAVAEKYRDLLQELQEEVIGDGHLAPRAVYGFFPCQSEQDDLVLYEPEGSREMCRFTFPRQKDRSQSCISDYFMSVGSGVMDVVALQLVTIGAKATELSREYFAKDKYTKYLYFHGLSVEAAEGLAELVHKRIREELGIAGDDAPEVEQIFHQQYRGKRYSFGYGACPDLEDQEKLVRVLDAENSIGVRLTTGYQLEPEQSTSALVVHHPDARYFNV